MKNDAYPEILIFKNQEIGRLNEKQAIFHQHSRQLWPTKVDSRKKNA
jgi:hypothetical protein